MDRLGHRSFFLGFFGYLVLPEGLRDAELLDLSGQKTGKAERAVLQAFFIPAIVARFCLTNEFLGQPVLAAVLACVHESNSHRHTVHFVTQYVCSVTR